MKTVIILLLFIALAGCSNRIDKAKSFENERKFDEALSILSEIDKNDKDYEKAFEIINDIYYEKGVEFLKNENYEKAIDCFCKVDEQDKNYKISVSKSNYCKGIQAEKNNSPSIAIEYFKNVKNEDDLYAETQNKITKLSSGLSVELSMKIIGIARDFQKEYDIINFIFNIPKMTSLQSDLKNLFEKITDEKVKEYSRNILKAMSSILKLYKDKNKIEYQGVGGGTALVYMMKDADNIITNTQRKLSEYSQKKSLNIEKNFKTLFLILSDYNKQIELITNDYNTKIKDKLKKLKNLKIKIEKKVEGDVNLKDKEVDDYYKSLNQYLDANIDYYTFMVDKVVVNGRGEELVSSSPELTKKENNLKRFKENLLSLEAKYFK
jgi:hypothetical protein